MVMVRMLVFGRDRRERERKGRGVGKEEGREDEYFRIYHVAKLVVPFCPTFVNEISISSQCLGRVSSRALIFTSLAPFAVCFPNLAA